MDIWASDEVHFLQHGSRCRMWIPPKIKDPVLLHAPTRKSVGYFGAVALSFAGKPRSSMERLVGNLCCTCAVPVASPAVASWSFPTMLPIIILESTSPGGRSMPAALLWTFCPCTVPNSIPLNEFGNSRVAFVYTTATSNI